MTQTIFGIHPVKEALKSPSLLFEKIFLGTKAPHPSLQSILDLAVERNIPVTVVDENTLARMARGGLHQNVVAIVKGTPYVDLQGMLSPVGERKKRRVSFSSSTASRIRRI